MSIEELKEGNLILFECISGSRAFGLDTPNSDVDIKGVFYMPREKFFGLDYVPQVANATNDVVYYELGRFIDLLVKNNPNILELLATPDDCVLLSNPIIKLIKLGDFLSRLCKETFAGYAITQIRKARGYKKKIVNPMGAERKSVLDFCYIMKGSSSIVLKHWLSSSELRQEQCGLSSISHAKGLYAVYVDREGQCKYSGIVSNAAANDVSLSSIAKGEALSAYLFFNKEAYSSYCKDYKEYWDWVVKRNDTRYQGNMAHGKQYDAKNMMHTIRLLQVAEEILRTGLLNPRRNNREELLSIKRGDFDYDDLLKMADKLMLEIESAEANSALPEYPDKEFAEALLVQMRNRLYA